MIDHAAEKKALRREVRARRDAFFASLTPDERALLATEAAARLEPEIARATCVSGFVPFASEMDPIGALVMASERGLATCLPHVVSRDQPLRFLRWRPGDPLFTGMYGLHQPAEDAPEVEPDLIVMPLVAFDRAMHRMGNGAGFYDRTVARMPSARRIAFAWSVQEVAKVPVDPWDEPLDAIVTELGRIEPREAV